MKEVKEYYDTYNYPLVTLYTHRQEKKHNKLILNILSYAFLEAKDLKDKRILDAGCGTGEKSIFFAKNEAKVTSIDLSSGQLLKAKESALKNNLKIDFQEKDIVNDNLSSLGKFDIIISTGVLHHTEDAYKGFLQLSSLLKKDGIIIIALYHKFSRVRYRLIRFFLHTFFSNDPKRLDKHFKDSFLLRPLKKAPKNSIYDRYLVPFESYHTVKEVKKWFLEEKIEVLSFSKEFKGIEAFKVFEKKTLFFIAGIKK